MAYIFFVVDYFRSSQIILDHFTVFQNILDHFRTFYSILDHIRVLEYFREFQNILEYFRTFQSILDHIRVFQNILDHFYNGELLYIVKGLKGDQKVIAFILIRFFFKFVIVFNSMMILSYLHNASNRTANPVTCTQRSVCIRCTPKCTK